MATVSLGLLLAVAITSMRLARRSMSYETWYGIHLYAYLAIALGFAHQLVVGTDFVDDPIARDLLDRPLRRHDRDAARLPVRSADRRQPRHRFRVGQRGPRRARASSRSTSPAATSTVPARAGQYLTIRFMTPRLVAIPPVQPVRRAERTLAPGHDQGPRRRFGRGASIADRHLGHRRRPVRQSHDGTPDRRPRTAHRRRDRRDAAPGDPRGARGPHPGHAAVPRPASARSRVQARVGHPRPVSGRRRRLPGRLAAVVGIARPARPDRARAARAGRRPARGLPLRAVGVSCARPRRRSSSSAFQRAGSTSNASSTTEPMPSTFASTDIPGVSR